MLSRFARRELCAVHARAGIRTRRLASVSSSTPFNPSSVGPYQVFDRHAKRLQRDRAALREDGARSRVVDYVRDEIADMLIERLLVSFMLVSWSFSRGHGL